MDVTEIGVLGWMGVMGEIGAIGVAIDVVGSVAEEGVEGRGA